MTPRRVYDFPPSGCGCSSSETPPRRRRPPRLPPIDGHRCPGMRRPNFLVILVDDLRHDEFGAGGHPYMETPHIDRLADEGVLFERAFHTTPICSPNRASIL